MPEAGMSSKLSGLSVGLILGTVDGGIRGFLVGAGGAFITSAFTGLAGGGFIGNKIGSLAGMLVGALTGLMVGALESLVKHDSTCIGSRIKDGVAIGENWFSKVGSLAGSLLGVIGGGIFGFKIAVYAGGMVGILKSLNNGVKRAELGFKEGFMAGFTGERQQLPSPPTQQPAERKVSTLGSSPSPAVPASLSVGPYLNILKNLGVLPQVIKQIELRLENPLLKRLMNYVVTEYIFPLFKPSVDQSVAIQPSRANNDNKENTSPENSSIAPEIPASSTFKSLGSFSQLSVSPPTVVQPDQGGGGKPLFAAVKPTSVVKPSSPLSKEKKFSTHSNSTRFCP